jgi:hypothetical protein
VSCRGVAQTIRRFDASRKFLNSGILGNRFRLQAPSVDGMNPTHGARTVILVPGLAINAEPSIFRRFERFCSDRHCELRPILKRSTKEGGILVRTSREFLSAPSLYLPH